MKGLLLYTVFVIFWTIGAVFIGVSIERYTSPDIGSLVMLGLFFGGLVVSWIATVLVIDGSLKNFNAEKEQLEAERKGREYMDPPGFKPDARLTMIFLWVER